jgi:hypothetical protein
MKTRTPEENNRLGLIALGLVLIWVLACIFGPRNCEGGVLGTPSSVYPVSWQIVGSAKGGAWDFSSQGFQWWYNPFGQEIWILEVVVKVRVDNPRRVPGVVNVKVQLDNDHDVVLIDEGFATDDYQVHTFRWSASGVWVPSLIVSQPIGLLVEGTTEDSLEEAMEARSYITYSFFPPR